MRPTDKNERIVVQEGVPPQRLDKILAALPSVGSREGARKVLRSGKVTIDGKPAGPEAGGQIVRAGAEIVIAWNKPGTGQKIVAASDAMSRAGAVILYEDDDIVAVDKPAGLLTDAADEEQAKRQDTLRKRVSALCGPVFPAHRIDRYTTGVVLFSKSEPARDHLKAQWIERAPLREYRAWVEGRMPRASGRFADWMVWDSRALLQRQCQPDTPGAWLAEASYEVVETFGSSASEIRVRLVTGRRNQIRLHAMLSGHPLIGEALYRREQRGRREPAISFQRQALHAAKLGIIHPRTHESVIFEAPLPEDLEGLIRRLRSDF